MAKVKIARKVLPICDKCVYNISTEYFDDRCTRCCAPHIVSIDFLIDCLTNSEHMELNRRHISKRCPNYDEILKALEIK